jgi:hypothetical protein
VHKQQEGTYKVSLQNILLISDVNGTKFSVIFVPNNICGDSKRKWFRKSAKLLLDRYEGFTQSTGRSSCELLYIIAIRHIRPEPDGTSVHFVRVHLQVLPVSAPYR